VRLPEPEHELAKVAVVCNEDALVVKGNGEDFIVGNA